MAHVFPCQPSHTTQGAICDMYREILWMEIGAGSFPVRQTEPTPISPRVAISQGDPNRFREIVGRTKDQGDTMSATPKLAVPGVLSHIHFTFPGELTAPTRKLAPYRFPREDRG